MSHRRVVIAAWSIGVLFSTLLSLALGELTIRAIHVLRDGIPFSEAPSGRVGAIVLDPGLGWRATAHYEQDLFDTTHRGVVYRVHRSQGQQGFRSYGDVQARRPRLLVIGTPLRRLRRSPMTRRIMRCSARSWEWKCLPMELEDMEPYKNI